MRYNLLGRTGLIVSELCLGTMTFGGQGALWENFGALGQAESNAILRVAVEAGVNFIDTADGYADGQSEEILGQGIRQLGLRRDELVISTKVFGPTGPGPNSCGSSRSHVMDAVRGSLKRLQVDHVDLYQLHGFDPLTPMEETLRTLDDLVRQGYVRYVGVSNWAAWQIMKALGISERLGLARFECLQAYYTIAGRDLERDVAPLLLSEGVGLMVWGPLASGLLAGKYPRGGSQKGQGRRSSVEFPPVERDRAEAVLEAMRPIAEARGATLAQVAIAWLIHQPTVTSVILGARRPDQLADTLKATDLSLSEEDRRELDEVSRLPAEYPGWMLEFMRAQRAGHTASLRHKPGRYQ